MGPGATGCAVINSATVEQATCAFFPGTTIPFTGAQLTITSRLSTCGYEAALAGSGNVLGRWRELTAIGLVGEMPGFGGACTGYVGLPTGQRRFVWNCPTCQFVLVL